MLSIIIPVYNVSATLDRCLESVVSQLPVGAEVIIVDDGSTDGSGDICDRWADGHDFIRVLHQSNAGLSAARNAGIVIARHDYITFVDSDDYVGQGVYAKVMSLLATNKDIDIAEYEITKHLPDGTCEHIFLGDNTYHDSMDYLLRQKAYNHTYAWNKVYKRSLFDTVRYPVGKHFEDTCVMPLLLKHANVIATVSGVSYHYVVNPKGISCNATADDYSTLLDANWKMWQSISCTNDEKADYYMAIVNIQIVLCCMSGQPPMISTCRLSLRKLKGKSWIKALMVKTCGIRLTCGIFVLLKKLISFARNTFLLIFA